MWNEEHRCYHTLEHLRDILQQIQKDQQSIQFTHKEYENLVLTAIFHDCIYDPLKSNNEEKSAFLYLLRQKEIILML